MSNSKKEIDILLNKMYQNNKEDLFIWLDKIKKDKINDGKIPGLFNNSRIQIITSSKDGVYNLILEWIKNNIKKFEDYDFTNIPDSSFTSLQSAVKKQLLNWISIDNLNKKMLSKNPNAINYLKENPDIIAWDYLSGNQNAIELLSKKFEKEKSISIYDLKILKKNKKIDWKLLSGNPNAIELLKQNYNEIDWDMLSGNPKAIELLKDKINEEDEMSEDSIEDLRISKKINWNKLSTNPNAIKILEDNGKKIEWEWLSENPNAIELLIKNQGEIDWDILSSNPNAIELLQDNYTKINWNKLSSNPNAIDLLKTNKKLINWNILSANPNAIELLQENEGNINWNRLSQNPNAIELLRKKINEEEDLDEEELEELNSKDKINWDYLTANPCIFEIVGNKIVKTFSTFEDVERWCNNPEIHPIKDTPMPAMCREYYDIYEKAYKIMKKNKLTNISNEDTIINLFPKTHLLFGNIDLTYYLCVKKNHSNYKELYNGKENKLIICELLTERLEYAFNKKTVYDTEIELLRNRYNDINNPNSNLNSIKYLIENYNKNIINSFLSINYLHQYKYPQRIEIIKKINLRGYYFINFLENNKISSCETILEYFTNTLKKSDAPKWISEALKNYYDYKIIIKDIDDCFNPDSGIIENIEDKKYTIINDPIDEYFDVYEKKLAEIKKPKYSQLIDLTTFKIRDNIKYLNDSQYIEFKKERDKYDIEWKKYLNSQKLYETNKIGSSPKPPGKPKIILPWGKVHIIANEIDPIHIKDDVIIKFKEEYDKVRPIIEEYNLIKNMSYKVLMEHVGKSPLTADFKLMEGNELLSMTKEQIANNILFDYSDLADKCSESIDILTNEELNNENYPLSKLQLMARLKVYTPDKKKYRTECIYAPKLYNYLINCINSKEPFVNPVTKAKYTKKNIEELMKIMRIIDPNIKVPEFIKHRNDTGLKINYTTIDVDINDIGYNSSYGTIKILRFNKIYLSRIIGGVEYIIFELCHIPADIEASGDFATSSTDLTSSAMLFRIFKLFNEGRLLYNYLPPYFIPHSTNISDYLYIKPQINFNKYKDYNKWLRYSKSNKSLISKEELVNKFIYYAQEVNNYTF